MEGTGGFERWYRDLHPRLLGVLTGVTGDGELASDATDEALTRALERWDRVATMASPDGWVYRVALNVVRRRQRRASLEQRLLRRFKPTETLAGPAGELWLLVATLAPRQRTAVVLRHVARLTEPEIAQAMGISRGAVNSTLRAAYDRLRPQLTEPEPELVLEEDTA